MTTRNLNFYSYSYSPLARNDLLSGYTLGTNYILGKKLIERQNSRSWFIKLYKNSLLHDFWLVLASKAR